MGLRTRGAPVIALLSTAVNSGRITAPGASTIVAKRVTFFISFLLTYLAITSLVRSMQHVRFLVKVLVTLKRVADPDNANKVKIPAPAGGLAPKIETAAVSRSTKG